MNGLAATTGGWQPPPWCIGRACSCRSFLLSGRHCRQRHRAFDISLARLPAPTCMVDPTVPRDTPIGGSELPFRDGSMRWMGVITELKICLKHVPAQLPFRLDQRTGTKFLGLGFFDISILFKNVRNLPNIPGS